MLNRPERLEPQLSIPEFLKLANEHYALINEIKKNAITISLLDLAIAITKDAWIVLEKFDLERSQQLLLIQNKQLLHQYEHHGQDARDDLAKLKQILEDRVGVDMSARNEQRYARTRFFGIKKTPSSISLSDSLSTESTITSSNSDSDSFYSNSDSSCSSSSFSFGSGTSTPVKFYSLHSNSSDSLSESDIVYESSESDPEDSNEASLSFRRFSI